jgi:DNA-binding NarL/FixJ family response regulator
LLLDITMPGRSGLDLLPEIKGLQPAVRVLVVSMHPEEEYGVRALRAGAAGYVWKQCPIETLVGAVRCVLDGGRYISPRLVEALATEVEHGGQRAHDRLSSREFEVMRLIAGGANPKSIADGLSLSPKTVSTYRARLLDKLNLHTDADIVRYALQNRLIE